jgi:rubrerythrin
MGVEFDFSKLDAMDVLDLACFFEREAAHTYEQLASWAEQNSPGAAEFFERMARLESAHDSQIEERRRELFGNRPSRYTDAAPWEVEVPDFNEVGPTLTLEQAYALALGAEERAEAYFRQAMEYISASTSVSSKTKWRTVPISRRLGLSRPDSSPVTVTDHSVRCPDRLPGPLPPPARNPGLRLSY